MIARFTAPLYRRRNPAPTGKSQETSITQIDDNSAQHKNSDWYPSGLGSAGHSIQVWNRTILSERAMSLSGTSLGYMRNKFVSAPASFDGSRDLLGKAYDRNLNDTLMAEGALYVYRLNWCETYLSRPLAMRSVSCGSRLLSRVGHISLLSGLAPSFLKS